jgi:hypothetical protein
VALKSSLEQCAAAKIARLTAEREEARTRQAKFAVGDVVRLRSGGALMTVQSLLPYEPYALVAVWHDSSARLCWREFFPATLTKVRPGGVK